MTSPIRILRDADEAVQVMTDRDEDSVVCCTGSLYLCGDLLDALGYNKHMFPVCSELSLKGGPNGRVCRAAVLSCVQCCCFPRSCYTVRNCDSSHLRFVWS